MSQFSIPDNIGLPVYTPDSKNDNQTTSNNDTSYISNDYINLPDENVKKVYYDKFTDCKSVASSIQVVIIVLVFLASINVILAYNVFSPNSIIMTRLLNIFILMLTAYAAYKQMGSSCFSIFDDLNVRTHDVITETSKMYYKTD